LANALGGNGMLDPLRIELRAITLLTDYLTRNQRLIPNIATNDKTPSWDGDVIVYNSDSTAKANIEGRVPVQVKGTMKKNLSQGTIKFPLMKSDLKNYLSSNGVIIFVVYLKDCNECKIYYSALLSFDLARLNKEIGSKNSIKIELHEFPKDNSVDIINIFLNFLANQKLQGGTVDDRLLSLPDLQNFRYEYDGFHFQYTGIGLNNFYDVANYSLKHPTYIYLKPKGLNIKIPIDKMLADAISTDLPLSIIVDGEVLYDTYSVDYTRNGHVIRIGKSITCNIDKGTLDFKLSGKLRERIVDVKFLLALVSNKEIQINNVKFPQIVQDNPFIDVKAFDDILKELEEIHSTLDKLGIETDLDMDKVSDKESKVLFMLVRAILYDETVPLSVNNASGIGNVTIANLTITLICTEAGDGKFHLTNYYGENELCCKITGQDVILSPYIPLKKATFKIVSNINYSRIVGSIKNAPKSKAQDETANLLILEMLKAYDEQSKKKAVLLESSLEIINWIAEHNAIDRSILTLNKLQIIKRMRKLSTEEIDKLLEIKRNATDNTNLVGANILLESFQEAQHYYDMLTEEQKKEFDTYPIVNLWGQIDKVTF
jgi:hypothetical protein